MIQMELRPSNSRDYLIQVLYNIRMYFKAINMMRLLASVPIKHFSPGVRVETIRLPTMVLIRPGLPLPLWRGEIKLLI
jgi:hypothetical protein